MKKNILKPAKAQEMLDQVVTHGFRLSDVLYKRVSEILEENLREQKQAALQEKIQQSLDDQSLSIPAAGAFADIRERR